MKPKITIESDGAEHYEHDAFGVITVSNIHGGIGPLFGSELKHSGAIRVSIQRASYRRQLSNNWVHPEKTIVEVYLTQDQWARMVSSTGMGEGTPVTIKYAPPKDTVRAKMPDLDVEPANSVFQRENKDRLYKVLTAAKEAYSLVKELQAQKTVAKKDLAPLADLLSQVANRLPGDLGFLEDMFTEHMEKTIAAAKIEMETFMAHCGVKSEQINLQLEG